ncbi:hypothetical protein BH160DRAFT_1172 [Burkholderia sp. H160]|nr:hypothetical protein BH160DRAFT_1172 [Burkholderia sp. H160]
MMLVNSARDIFFVAGADRFAEMLATDQIPYFCFTKITLAYLFDGHISSSVATFSWAENNFKTHAL